METLTLPHLSLKPLQLLTEPSTRHGHTCSTGMANRAAVLALTDAWVVWGWGACFPSTRVFHLLPPSPSFNRQVPRTFLRKPQGASADCGFCGVSASRKCPFFIGSGLCFTGRPTSFFWLIRNNLAKTKCYRGGQWIPPCWQLLWTLCTLTEMRCL